MQIPAAPEAHWQMGKAERKIGFLKEMSISALSELEVDGAASVKTTVAKLAQASNQLVSAAVFSPNQWALGAGIRLPASLASTDNDPAVVTRVVEGSSFWDRLQIEQVCSEAFFRAASSSALRRSVLSRLRPQPGPFDPGELLMYWRASDRKKNLHGRWHGPARCLGRDANGDWLVHNRIPILAAPTLVLCATMHELEDARMNDLFGENMRLSHRRRSIGGPQHGFPDLHGEFRLPAAGVPEHDAPPPIAG